jgi:hypothetical protein
MAKIEPFFFTIGNWLPSNFILLQSNFVHIVDTLCPCPCKTEVALKKTTHSGWLVSF